MLVLGWWNRLLHSRLTELEKEKVGVSTFNSALARRDEETAKVVTEIREMSNKSERWSERTHQRIDDLSIQVARVVAKSEMGSSRSGQGQGK